MTDAHVLTVILDSLTITATSLSILHKNSTLPVIIPSANHWNSHLCTSQSENSQLDSHKTLINFWQHSFPGTEIKRKRNQQIWGCRVLLRFRKWIVVACCLLSFVFSCNLRACNDLVAYTCATEFHTCTYTSTDAHLESQCYNSLSLIKNSRELLRLK